MSIASSSAAYSQAQQQYAPLGVDTQKAIERLSRVSISLHCWQGDDVGGFESSGEDLGGGLAVTGNYPGKACNPDQLRADLEKAYSLIPGRHRLNLHAFYLESQGKKIERNQITSAHFRGWIDWCKAQKLGMDFNPTCFAHPMASDGFTLAHRDPAIRRFWIDHCTACRRIGSEIGQQLGSPCVTNVWIPDGYKDIPADRLAPRQRLLDALDQVFAEQINPAHNLDAVESKLFGIGSESYVVGSFEFYYAYAITRRKLMCLDAGHFHPTETITDKISSALMHLPEILLHVSRGVRWDSDHVVILNDDLQAMMLELVRGNFLERTHIGLDFFDASINRLAAWVIGTRATLKALLLAMLEPTAKLRDLENAGDYTTRLALMEQLKTMPFGAVWDHYCAMQNVPVESAWLAEVKTYEKNVLSRRG
ncbi:MAG: L-rhamnose isomerase [Phycisphaeraceae bacterium]|nr:L-rhamnose isomerase [Phycisphaeraceae bacterium]